jgi:hypothetical protein
MSTQTAEPQEMGTKPLAEHEWLKNLVGDWRYETEMSMGEGQPTQRSEGSEKIESHGGLWAFGHGEVSMGGGPPMTYYAALGYDVTLREYRSCWIASVSSHLWTKSGQLSADGKTLTLTGDGPNMQGEGMIKYRDVFELVDADHFTLSHYGQDNKGGWEMYFKANYSRK